MTAFLERLEGRPVIIGTGIGGLMTALMLASEPVVLVTKGAFGAESSTMLAQGGIAAGIGSDDSADLHLADTLAAGDGLCDAVASAKILAEAPAVIAMLQRIGVEFDTDARGAIALGLEAAHSRRRIVHIRGDGAGAAIMDALMDAVLRTPSITVLAGFEARRLLTVEGAVCGVLCATAKGSVIIPSSRVVLATGGIGGLFEATTNPSGNFGQGIVLAARAGAILADMEFVQFHPTALVSSGHPLGLISEAVRGEGALLIDETGARFMTDIPGQELAPRDIVARAIADRIAAGHRVFLDARTTIDDRFAARFPAIDGLCRAQGIDPACRPIPVMPAAHYHMGGVLTDAAGRSSLPGLWAVGEVASTGLHGANRLASNSLLEACVMGMWAAQDIKMTRPTRRTVAVLEAHLVQPQPAAVRQIASRHLGLRRHKEGLSHAIAECLPLAVGDGPRADPAMVALAIAVFALLRTESRGAHARTDFPGQKAVAERRMMNLEQVIGIAQSIIPKTSARSA